MDALIALIGGLFVLLIGGELLVRGAVRAAERLGVSPLLIGLTLVGFGTSAPEMVISVKAAMSDSPGIAIGNFVGSSISNILLILGTSALLFPIAVSSKALSRDGSVVLVTAVLFAFVSYALPYDTFVGWAFLAMLFSYLVYAWRQERVAPADDHTSAFARAEAHGQLRFPQGWFGERMRRGAFIMAPVLLAIVGLVGVMIGGHFLVNGAVAIAREFDVSETVIGLTIVAVGTSMPELVTSLVAACRGQPSVAIGNILGSNIYNILGVGGITAVLSPTTVPERIIYFDNLVMVAAAVALIIFARSGFRVSRWEGAALLAGYAIYLYTLWPRDKAFIF